MFQNVREKNALVYSIYDVAQHYSDAGYLAAFMSCTGKNVDNSVVSPAIEFKKEGMVFGMAAKMFIVAGPVIVYGTLTSMAVGLIYYLVRVV